MHTSLNFDPSVWEVFWPLMVGARVVIAPAGMLESSALLSYMAEQSVSCAYFVPSLLGVLVKEPRLSEVSSLRYVISGGEKLPLGVMQEFQELSRAELHHSYGPTETVAATEWTCEAGAERVLIGRPIGNTQVYVLDGQHGAAAGGSCGRTLHRWRGSRARLCRTGGVDGREVCAGSVQRESGSAAVSHGRSGAV